MSGSLAEIAAAAAGESVEAQAPDAGSDAGAHGEPSQAEQEAEIAARFKRFIDGADSQKDDAPKAKEPAAEANPADDPAKESEPEKPKDAKAEAQAEVQLARAQRDLKRETTEKLAEKKARAEAETKAQKLEADVSAMREKLKANPLAAMVEMSGLSFPEIMAKAAKGEFDAPPETKLPDDVREAVEWARAEKKAREDAKAAEKKEAARQADLALVKSFMADVADDYPFIDETDADWIMSEAYKELEQTKQQPDLRKIAERSNAAAEATFAAWLKSEKLLKRVLAEPSTKTAVLNALGYQQQQPAPISSKPAQPARPIAAQTEVVSRAEKRESAEDERATALKALRAFQERQSA